MIHKILITLLLFAPLAKADEESIRRGIVKSSYGLALNLISARNEGLTCDFDAYEKRIVDVISEVFYIATQEEKDVFGASIPKESDVLKNYSFKLAIQGEMWTSDLAVIQKNLVGTTFWTPSRGAYGSFHSVEFLDNGKAKLGSLELLDEDPWTKWNYSETDWSLSNNGEHIQLRIGTEVYNYTEEGTMHKFVPAKVEEGKDPYSSSADECEA